MYLDAFFVHDLTSQMSSYPQKEWNVTGHHRQKLAAIEHPLKNIVTFEIEFFYLYFLYFMICLVFHCYV